MPLTEEFRPERSAAVGSNSGVEGFGENQPAVDWVVEFVAERLQAVVVVDAGLPQIAEIPQSVLSSQAEPYSGAEPVAWSFHNRRPDQGYILDPRGGQHSVDAGVDAGVGVVDDAAVVVAADAVVGVVVVVGPDDAAAEGSAGAVAAGDAEAAAQQSYWAPSEKSARHSEHRHMSRHPLQDP